MNARNINKGRHGIGSPIARSGITPPSRTGRPSGSFVGTGVNAKTKSPGRYTGTQPQSGTDSKAESFVNQAPSPWDNSQPSSNPTTGAPQAGPSVKVGGLGGKTGAGGVPRGGSAGYGSAPRANVGAVGISGTRGKGSDNGKVVGKQQPRRVGNVFNQPSAKFYGR